ncbi:alpha/beta hydrolase family protein [Streptomyces sp. NPDC058417]|uniref:alpha/beta hydrolase family protein n=1 Tax=unclassified Streptomyces TaxID=2593676 RepID=UPI00365CAE0B
MTPPTLSRGALRFSPDGLRAVCVAVDADGGRCLETWHLTDGGPRRALRNPLHRDLPLTQCVALDDGRALLSWHEPGGHQHLELLAPDGPARRLGPCPAPLRLLAAPTGSGWLATAVSYEAGDDADSPGGPGSSGGPDGAEGVSTVHRVGDGADGVAWLTPVARIAGRLGGIAVHGSRLAVTAVVAGVPTPLLIDPDAPAGLRVTPLTAPADGTPTADRAEARHVVLAGGGRVLLAVRTADGVRLALADDSAVRLLDGPSAGEATVTPVALDPAGTTLAVTVSRGARSELALYGTDSGELRRVALPPGHLGSEAAWSARGLWLPYSAPTRPASLGWLPPGATALRTAPARPGLHAGRLERLPGAGGSVEAVVHGPDWRTGGPLVVALHGGPDRHWTLGFEPLFQLLAAAGITVVAPNQRGSTGYGRAHADAIRGAWGGPDLADVRALRAHLDRERGPHAPRPAVHGSSYGAFLALLAAAADPEGWSGCVAVAPFTSVPALYADGHPPTRNLIDRLGGHDAPGVPGAPEACGDGLGPRDLERLAPRVRTPVLLIHGRRDETIPVAHSRALARALTRAGHAPVTYREPADRGHQAVSARPGTPLAREITDFLTRPDPARGPLAARTGRHGGGGTAVASGDRPDETARGGDIHGDGVRDRGAPAAAAR